jgi:Ca2+-binding EF-hand superfamily protein
MKTLQVLTMLTLTLGLAQIASAEQSATDGKRCGRMQGMREADTNKDGAISREEFMTAHQARAEKMFTKMDTNKDGKIDQAERKSAKEMMGKNCKMKDYKMDDESALK